MSGFAQARQQAIMDAELVAGDHIAYSANGTSETASLARTPVGSWTAATAASPSVKGNSGALTTAAATAPVVVTHFAVMSLITGGVQKTDWQPLTVSKSLGTGDQGTWAAGALTVSMD